MNIFQNIKNRFDQGHDFDSSAVIYVLQIMHASKTEYHFESEEKVMRRKKPPSGDPKNKKSSLESSIPMSFKEILSDRYPADKIYHLTQLIPNRGIVENDKKAWVREITKDYGREPKIEIFQRAVFIKLLSVISEKTEQGKNLPPYTDGLEVTILASMIRLLSQGNGSIVQALRENPQPQHYLSGLFYQCASKYGLKNKIKAIFDRMQSSYYFGKILAGKTLSDDECLALIESEAESPTQILLEIQQIQRKSLMTASSVPSSILPETPVTLPNPHGGTIIPEEKDVASDGCCLIYSVLVGLREFQPLDHEEKDDAYQVREIELSSQSGINPTISYVAYQAQIRALIFRHIAKTWPLPDIANQFNGEPTDFVLIDKPEFTGLTDYFISDVGTETPTPSSEEEETIRSNIETYIQPLYAQQSGSERNWEWLGERDILALSQIYNLPIVVMEIGNKGESRCSNPTQLKDMYYTEQPGGTFVRKDRVQITPSSSRYPQDEEGTQPGPPIFIRHKGRAHYASLTIPEDHDSWDVLTSLMNHSSSNPAIARNQFHSEGRHQEEDEEMSISDSSGGQSSYQKGRGSITPSMLSHSSLVVPSSHNPTPIPSSREILDKYEEISGIKKTGGALSSFFFGETVTQQIERLRDERGKGKMNGYK